jgi:tyrosine-specific transport protein
MLGQVSKMVKYKVSTNKFIGGILLIVGTSIGGGMLALPVATAETGFVNSIFYLFLCWLIMTSGALLTLEVTLTMPKGSNIISMAKRYLGTLGAIVAWIAYLLLLYALLSAYIAGGSDVMHQILRQQHIHIRNTYTAITFTTIFGIIVYWGIHAVDYVNRAFMIGKLSIYIILVLTIIPHLDLSLLENGNPIAIHKSLMILITSFGFSAIVPSLCEYFDYDKKSLRLVIIIGSLIPLLCYIVWDGVIMGVIPSDGDNGLIAINNSMHVTSNLVSALADAVDSKIISAFFGFFSSICMVTAFLGVSIGLFDFLADGLKMKKRGLEGKSVFCLTFIPPLAIVLFWPGIYLHALAYAGICCIVLQLLLPAAMSWRAYK